MLVTTPPTTYDYPKFNLGEGNIFGLGRAGLGADPVTGEAIDPTATTPGIRIWSWLSLLSMAASTYHGYKRNHSIGWALAWGAAGAALPVVTPVIALAQGFGKRKGAH